MKLARLSAKGFSLLEILVVLTMIGVLVGVVVLSFSNRGAEQNLQGEAERLSLRIELARSYALQRNREWGIFIRDQSYEFAEYSREDQGWLIQSQRPFGEITLEDNLTLTVQSDDFEGFGPSEEQERDEEQAVPEVVIFSSGELTPFEATLTPEWESEPWLVRSDGVSRVSVRRRGDEEEDEETSPRASF